MRPLLVLAAFAAASLAAPVAAERLTLERIHADPDLNGKSPRALTLAPDGRRAAFVRGREDDQFQLDLWEFDLASGKTRRLVDSLAIEPKKELSDAEKARRERARTASLKGILSYRWAPDGRKLLFTVGERLWLYDLDRKGEAMLRALTAPGVDVADAKVSPKGGFVSYVGGQNLHVIDLATGKSVQLTHDGKGPIHNGEAEFVAQEEMDRRTGYWWAPDDSAIAYARFDESGVDLVKRTEVYAERTDVIEQRYPAAGRPNVTIQLGLIGPRGGATRWMDLGGNPDIYLGRVDWIDGSRVSFQRQSRDQRRLDLIAVDAKTLQQTVLLTETAEAWIELNDDLHFLEKENAFLWNSSRSGYAQLGVYGMDGRLKRALTSGAFDVDALLAVDEKNGVFFYASNREDVSEKHVYRARLDGSDAGRPTRVSEGHGWHEAVFGKQANAFIDTYSDPATPPQVSLRKADGTRIAWIEENALKPGHPYWPYKDSLIAPEYGELRGESGDLLRYRVYKPLGFDPAKRYPVYMTYYGGPGSQFVRKNWSSHFDQFMAQRGYVVFSLDNRGSPRRGRAFANAIFRELGKVEVADQFTGVEWLRQQPWVDATRIGLFGWSYGGYQTLMLLAKGGDRFAIGVAGAPVTDWALYDTHYTERFLDSPHTNADGYQRSSVLHWIKEFPSDKLLLIHGMADDNVLFTNSTKVMAALQKQGTQFQLMTYPGSKHGLSTPALRKHNQTLIAAYFDEKLKPSSAAAE